MAEPFTPDNAKGWIQTLLNLCREGGPVSLLLVILLGAIVVWGLTREVQRVHTINHALWAQLLDAQKAQIELAARCHPQGER